ncbi:MAG TPA: hypothetical protein VER33_00475, partial [Polyangiaceae bacterium]|nr:hypothetical protein [Polyangiaceae bacterium]
NRALAWSAAARGRTLVLDTIRTPSQLSSVLNIGDYDVFLIYEQSAAPTGELASLGAAWGGSQVLDSFARAGGVIVVLDGAQGTGEMPEFISNADLLDVTGHTPIALDDTATRLYNRAPADALGINIVSPLSPVPYTCTFDVASSPPADVVYVMTDARGPAVGSPMLVHRTFAPAP